MNRGRNDLTSTEADSLRVIDSAANINRHDLTVTRLLYFFFFAGFGLYTAYANLYFRASGFSGAQIGWLSSIVMLVGMLSSPLWGYINDRTSRPRLTLSAASLGAAISVVVLGKTESFSLTLVAGAVFGFFYSTLMPFIDQSNLRLLGEAHEGYARQRIWGTVGFIISAFVSGVVLERIGMQWVFPLIAVDFIIVLLFAQFLPVQLPPITGGPRSTAMHNSPSVFFRNPVWVLFMLGVFVLTLATAGMNNFIGIHLRDLGGSEELVGIIFSLGAISELPVMFFSPFLLRKMGIRSMIILAVIANVLRLMLYMVMPSAVWAVPISLLNALTFGVFWVAAVVYVNRLSPHGLGYTGQSLLTSAMSLASVVGASASGWIYDARGGAFLFGTLALLALASLIGFKAGFQKDNN